MRSVFLVLAALVIAVLGYVLFTQPDPALAPQAAPTATPPVDAAPAAPAALPEAAAPVAPTDASERTSAPVAEDRERPPLPENATWIDVFVVDAATQQPVAGADAWWANEAQFAAAEKLSPAEREAVLRDPDRNAERLGWQARSDRDGRIRISLGQHGSSVMARAGASYGHAWFQRGVAAPPEGNRVLLRADETLRVRVLDHAGRPAVGVPVTIENVMGDGAVHSFYRGGVPTGKDGVAAIRHVQDRRTTMTLPVAKWRIRVDFPALGVEPKFVDAQAPLPAEPIEFRLPPTGRLALRVTLDGRTPPALRRLQIHCGPRGDQEAINRSWMQRLDADGVARFPYVPLGKTVFVGNDDALVFWGFEVQGPVLPDQEVTAAIELAGEVVALSGRLLDASGAPIANERVMMKFNLNVSMGGQQVKTDADGRFAWILGRIVTESKRVWRIEQLSFERDPKGGSLQRVAVPPRALVAGNNDLGDQRFGADALVVAGRFVIDAPDGVHPHFHIERCHEARGAAGASEWRKVGALQIGVQPDFTFEVRGAVEAARCRIVVSSVSHLPVEPVEFVPGARDVQIALARGNTLQATCVLPDGVDLRRVVLRLVAPAPATLRLPTPVDPMRAHPDWASGAAKYRWPAVPAGSYTLRAEVEGFAHALTEINDVIVPPPAGGDPRLVGIDLRDLIGTLRVRVTTRPGEKVNYGDAILFAQPQLDDHLWRGSFLLVGGETVVEVPKRANDVMIVVSQCRPATVHAASGAIDVVMEPWPSVELRLLGIDALPPDAALMCMSRAASAHVADNRRYMSDSGSGNLGPLLRPLSSSSRVENGVATLHVGDAPHKLSVHVRLGDQGRSKALQQFTPQEVVAGAPVTVQVSADEIRAAIEELRANAKK